MKNEYNSRRLLRKAPGFAFLAVVAISVLVLWAGVVLAVTSNTVHPQITAQLSGTQLVQINTTTMLASLSATCPDAPTSTTENTIDGPVWTWTLGSVQFKAAQADAWGTPPNDGSKYGFTGSFMQSVNGASSATEFYTDLATPGYWEFQVTASVAYQTPDGSETWSGSATTGSSYQPPNLTETAVNVTIAPTTGISVFVNTKNFVHITYAPSDLTATLNITGGATFVGGVTSQAMTSAAEDVYIYGPNIYSSGGASSGEISVTVGPPSGQTGTNGNLAAVKSPAAPGSSGGFTYKATVPVQAYLTSDPVIATCNIMDQSIVSSGTDFVAAYLKPSTDSSLLGMYANHSLPNAQRDGALAMDNELINGGYNDLQNASNSLFEDLTTGVGLASVPPAINPLNLGVLPSLAAAVPGFPASAIQNISVAPSWTVNLVYPVISPNGQWTLPNLGDLTSNFSVNAKGPISFGDFANGYWTCSAAVGLVPNHNFQLQSGTYTLQGGWLVHPWNDPNAFVGFSANLQYTFPEGSAKNYAAGVGLVAGIKF